MNTKSKAAYERVKKTIESVSADLTRSEYMQFIEELAAHIEGIEDCIKEESEGES